MIPRIGDKIEVFWPKDKQYYPGQVAKYFPRSGKHRVNYDDGWTELLDLSHQRWRKRRTRNKSSSKEREKKVPGPLKGVGCADETTTAFHGVGEEMKKFLGSISDTVDRNISSLITDVVMAEASELKEKIIEEVSQKCVKHLRPTMNEQIASTVANFHESASTSIRSATEKSVAEIETRVSEALENVLQDTVQQSTSIMEAQVVENVTHFIQKETLRSEQAIEGRLEAKIERLVRQIHVSEPSDLRLGSLHVAVEKETAMARARQLVGLSATFWLMHYAGRDVPPRDQKLFGTWANKCAAMCLRFVAGKLNTFSGEDDAMRTWREKVDMVKGGIDLAWFLPPVSQHAITAARKNYASWNPPMGDREWNAEIVLLGVLSTRFEDAATSFEKKNRKRTALEIAIAVSLSALKTFG